MINHIYGARYFDTTGMSKRDIGEFNKLLKKGFKFIGKDFSYHCVKAFKREPIFEIVKGVGLFNIRKKTDEYIEDLVINYGQVDASYMPFNKFLNSGELLDIEINVVYICDKVREREIEVQKIYEKIVDNGFDI